LFLIDIREFRVMNAEYERAFGDHRQARTTTFRRPALPGPGAAVEIDRIVCVP
jgi:2-iminobutanoate/2-iminopropanoate deaminase